MKLKIYFILLIVSVVKTSNVYALHYIAIPSDSNRHRPIHIRIRFDKATLKDTLELNFYPDILASDPAPGLDTFKTVMSVANVDGSYDFNFKGYSIAPYGYIRVRIPSNKKRSELKSYVLLSNCLVHDGDNVTINIKFRQKHPGIPLPFPMNMDYTFEGPSARRYEVTNDIDSAVSKSKIPDGGSIIQQLFASEQLYIQTKLDYLSQHRTELPKDLYLQLYANIFYGKERYALYLGLSDEFKAISPQDTAEKQAFYEEYFSLSKKDEYSLDTSFLFLSPEYCPSVIRKLETDDELKNGNLSTERVLSTIIDQFKGALRDKLLTALLFKFARHAPNYNALLSRASAIVQNEECRIVLNKLGARRSGIVAYNFALPDRIGKTARLSDLKGKIVFVDFWYTGCGNCSDYFHNEVSKAESFFKSDTSVVFVTISIDKNQKEWIKSIEAGRYTSPLAINLFTQGLGADSPVIKNYGVLQYPSPMLINRKGEIIVYGDSELRYNDKTGDGLIKTILKAEKNY